MEFPGSSYFYTLAQLAMTIVGFSGIVVVLLQSFGGDTSNLLRLRARILIEAGLIAAGGAMLPQLLALSGIRHSLVWQLSSVVVAVILFVWASTYPMRRRGVISTAIPIDVWIGMVVMVLAAAGLLISAAVAPVERSPVVFGFAMTWMLFVACNIYVRAISDSLKQKHKLD